MEIIRLESGSCIDFDGGENAVIHLDIGLYLVETKRQFLVERGELLSLVLPQSRKIDQSDIIYRNISLT